MKLKLFTKPDVPLEAECISTAVISQLKVKEAEKMKIYHGNREANIADFFRLFICDTLDKSFYYSGIIRAACIPPKMWLRNIFKT